MRSVIKKLERQVTKHFPKGRWRILENGIINVNAFQIAQNGKMVFYDENNMIIGGSLIYETKTALLTFFPESSGEYRLQKIVHPVMYLPKENFDVELSFLISSLKEVRDFPSVTLFPRFDLRKDVIQPFVEVSVPKIDWSKPYAEVGDSRIQAQKESIQENYNRTLAIALRLFGRENSDIPKQDWMSAFMDEIEMAEDDLWFEATLNPNPAFQKIIKNSKPLVIK